MTCFLYYLPGVDAPITADRLRSLGLGYALAGAKPGLACVAVHRGPDNGQGQVVAVADRLGDSQPGYYPDKQTWRKIPAACIPLAGNQAVWVGCYTAKPPGPDDLLRSDALRGETVVLADGRPWIVPVVRPCVVDPDAPEAIPETYPAVPTVLGMDEEGHWHPNRIARGYEPAWDAAKRWFIAQQFVQLGLGDESARLEFDGIIEAAVDVLACNYAIGRTEVEILALFTSHVPRQILNLAIDWAAWEEWLKKNLSRILDGGDSSSGSEDLTLTIVPLTASG